MSRPVRLVRIEISAHSHATEDEDRVASAILSLIPEDVRKKTSINREVVEGHYSNPITIFSIKIEGGDASKILRYIGSKLSDIDKSMLASTLERRYDTRSGRLYLRLSKQDAFLGELKVMDGDDVIRLVIVFQGSPKLREVYRFLEEVGLVS